MTEPSQLDRTYSIILKGTVENGQAPHVTQIAQGLGVSMPEGRKALHELFGLQGFAGWLYPDTDYIVSNPPFSNLPTQYRISVDGQQKWFGQ